MKSVSAVLICGLFLAGEVFGYPNYNQPAFYPIGMQGGLNYWQPQVSNDYQTWQPFGGNGMMSGSSSISSSSSSSSGSKSEASTQLRDGRKLSIIVEYDPVKKIEVVKQCIRSTCEPASEKDCIVVDVPKSSC